MQFGQFQDFEGAGTVGHAAEKSALLKRQDEAMNTGFRLEVERFLHFLE